MELVVRGRRLDLSPELRAYAEDKVGRVTHLMNGMVMSVDIELYHERNRSIDQREVAEVTIFTKGHVLRARESGTDMKSAIDKVAGKMENRARRYKERVIDRHTGRITGSGVTPTPQPGLMPEELEPEPAIVKKKTVDLKPMTEDEAVLQIELLGHDFFVFASDETGDPQVLYRRRDGDYGLIVPRVQ
jgi:putative sigma-54 modulation protein